MHTKEIKICKNQLCQYWKEFSKTKLYVAKKTKIKIAELLVFPIVLFAWESWTMRKKDRKKLYAFELRA